MKTVEHFQPGALVRIYQAHHIDERGIAAAPERAEIRGADPLGIWFYLKGDGHRDEPIRYRFIPWVAVVEVEFL